VCPDGAPLQAEEVQHHAGPVQAEVAASSLDEASAAADIVTMAADDADGSTGDGREIVSGSASGVSRTVQLLRNRRFLRLWIAQIVSNLGDWSYVIAVEVLLAGSLGVTGLVRSMALILGVEGLTSALIGMTIAGPIVDRFPRVRIMVIADLARGLAVASLLIVDPTWPHIVVVAAVLGACRSMFHPAMMSTVPQIVRGRALVVANGVLSGTFHLAIMVGPAVGATLFRVAGARGAFALNAASFVLSAVLLARLGVVSRPVAEAARAERFSPFADLRAGLRYAIQTPIARGIALVMSLALLLLAAQGPFQIALVSDVLAPSASGSTWATILGAMTAAFGTGMVLGSAVSPWLSGRTNPRSLFVGSFVIAGAAYLVASRTPVVAAVISAWCVIGLAGGIINVTYETLLQVGTPDRFRGRVFATVESAQDGAYVLGAALIATLGAGIAPATAFLLVGLAFCGVAALALSVLPTGASMEQEAPAAA
jgi:MFS family permease